MGASGSSAQLRSLEEVTPGTIEAGGPQLLRMTGESLNQSIESAFSKELRKDRMSADSVITSGSAGGGFNFDLSHKSYDDFFEALLAGTWLPVGTDGVETISDAVFTNATNTINSAGGEIPDTTLALGQWFMIAGSANNDGPLRVSTTVAPTTTTLTLDAQHATVVEETSVSVTLSSSRLKNGLEPQRTFSIEKEFSDVAQFFMFTGMAPKTLSLNVATGSPVSGSFSFLGQQCARDNSSAFPGILSEVAETTTEVIDTVTGTSVIVDGVGENSTCVNSISLSVETGLREQRCLGSGIGASAVNVGTFEVTASVEVYFGNDSVASVYDKMRTGEAIDFSVCLTAPDGSGLAITLGKAKIASSEVVAGGIDTDVMMSLSLTSVRDAVTDSVLILDRLGSVA